MVPLFNEVINQSSRHPKFREAEKYGFSKKAENF